MYRLRPPYVMSEGFCCWRNDAIAGCLILRDDRLTIARAMVQRENAHHRIRTEALRRRGSRRMETKYQFIWPLGDVITALVSSGTELSTDRIS